MNTRDKDIMLPYLIIARMNGLKKDKPDDADDLVWVSDNGERFVLTPKGFVSAIQYSYMMLYKQTQNELEDVSADLADIRKKHEELKVQVGKNQSLIDDAVGKKSRKKIRSIINGKNYSTIEDRFEAIKKYLKEK